MAHGKIGILIETLTVKGSSDLKEIRKVIKDSEIYISEHYSKLLEALSLCASWWGNLKEKVAGTELSNKSGSYALVDLWAELQALVALFSDSMTETDKARKGAQLEAVAEGTRELSWKIRDLMNQINLDLPFDQEIKTLFAVDSKSAASEYLKRVADSVG